MVEMYNMLVGISSEIEKIKLELVDSEFYFGGRAREVQIKINIFQEIYIVILKRPPMRELSSPTII